MRTGPLAVAAISVSLLSWSAAAQEAVPVNAAPPPTGLALLITGGALSGIGALNLATSPICKTSLIGSTSTQNACFDVSLVLGGALVVVGVPLLIVGIGQHSRYSEWKQQHTVLAGLSLAPMPGGGMVGWSASF
jgi:hypothetical protein